MVNIFYTPAGEKNAHPVEKFVPNCWIHMVNPSDLEIENIAKETGVLPSMIKAALDEEERAHIEIEDEGKLILVDIPIMQEENTGLVYNTLPLGIIITPSCTITVCLKNTSVISDFIQGRIKNLDLSKQTRFLYQLLYNNAIKFLHYLKQIDKSSHLIQQELSKSMKNRELLQLLDLEKSLVYFSTSLKSNQAVIDRILATSLVQHFDDDQDILDDVVIENKQALEMASIHRDVLSGTMDAYASIIGNNQNKVMKLLTAITILLTIPNLIASFFGMNTGVPFQGKIIGFIFAVSLSIILVGITAIFMIRRKMF